MIKEITLLIVIIFLLFPVVYALCSDMNLQIKSVNTMENYITLQRLIGENEIEKNEISEIKIYVGNELKLTDEKGINILESRRINLPVSLSKGQEVRIDILDEDNNLCEHKGALTISEENIYNYPPCDYTKKDKGKWCVEDKVFTQKCVNGQFVDEQLVDCEALNKICKNGKCIEVGNENNMVSLTTSVQTTEAEEKLNPTIKKETATSPNEPENIELIQNRQEENSLNENSSINPVKIILNWIINFFK